MSEPLRILQIIGSMDVGGTEATIMNIYRKVDKAKVQFDFFVSVSKDCYYDEEIKKMGGNIYHTLTKSTHPLKFSRDLYLLIKRNKYSVVHVHAYNSMAAIPITVAKLAGGKKRIVHSHNSSSGNIGLHKVTRPLLNIMATHRFSCSDLASDWMYGNKKDQSVKINVPVDCTEYYYSQEVRNAKRREWGCENCTVYGHVGRMAAQKNHQYLIDIFNELSKADDTAKLVLVGKGELRSSIEAKVANLNLSDKVIFLGTVDHVSQVLNGLDAFIFPSLFEGLPGILLEAQANGLPCYISNVISKQIQITDLIHMISIERSPKEWAEVILQSRDRLINREAYNKLIYNLYDSQAVAQKLMDEYTEI